MSQSFKYDIDDVYYETPPLLGEALRRTVHRFFIEFLDQGGSKPHVTFKLNIDPPFSFRYEGVSKTVYGCRIGMNYLGDGDNQRGGQLEIKLLNYEGSSHVTYSSFDFEVKADLNLRGWIDKIACLKDFDFAVADAHNNLAGCRDFIAQSMILWHYNRLVSWSWVRQTPNTRFPGLEQVYQDRSFDVLIRHKFFGRRPDRVRVVAHPICPGVFLNPRFRRVTEYRDRQLPYRDEHPPYEHDGYVVAGHEGGWGRGHGGGGPSHGGAGGAGSGYYFPGQSHHQVQYGQY